MFEKIIDWFKYYEVNEKPKSKKELFWQNLMESLKNEPNKWETLENNINRDDIHLYNKEKDLSFICVFVTDDLGSDYNVLVFPGKEWPSPRNERDRHQYLKHAPEKYRYKFVDIVYPWMKKHQIQKNNEFYDKFA